MEIIFENEALIAINKPHGLLVHRTRLANDATEFALQQLRNQIGCKVYTIHRLDRKTSGVLLFAKSRKASAHIQEGFRERKVKKTYQALVRGYVPDKGIINYPLREGQKVRPAKTIYERVQTFEIPIPSGKFPTSRYSLINLQPLTGRFHQIRKHMAHIFHPIIGDRPHGCNKQNRLWKKHFGMTKMLLHAQKLEFQYPEGCHLHISAEISDEFKRVLGILNSTNYANEMLA